MINIRIVLLPKCIRNWWRFRKFLKSKSDIEPFCLRLFETGEYGWDRRYESVYWEHEL